MCLTTIVKDSNESTTTSTTQDDNEAFEFSREFSFCLYRLEHSSSRFLLRPIRFSTETHSHTPVIFQPPLECCRPEFHNLLRFKRCSFMTREKMWKFYNCAVCVREYDDGDGDEACSILFGYEKDYQHSQKYIEEKKQVQGTLKKRKKNIELLASCLLALLFNME